MAEAILRTKKIENLQVRSAGIHALDGYPIADNAKTLIEEANMPYTPVSQALSNEDVDWADYVFTMTDAHKRALLHSFPGAKEKVFTLKEFVQPNSSYDVHDPFGGDLETYRKHLMNWLGLWTSLKKKLLVYKLKS